MCVHLRSLLLHISADRGGGVRPQNIRHLAQGMSKFYRLFCTCICTRQNRLSDLLIGPLKVYIVYRLLIYISFRLFLQTQLSSPIFFKLYGISRTTLPQPLLHILTASTHSHGLCTLSRPLHTLTASAHSHDLCTLSRPLHTASNGTIRCHVIGMHRHCYFFTVSTVTAILRVSSCTFTVICWVKQTLFCDAANCKTYRSRTFK